MSMPLTFNGKKYGPTNFPDKGKIHSWARNPAAFRQNDLQVDQLQLFRRLRNGSLS